MGIHNKRLLDIHFSDRHVCGLLIYIDYFTTLETRLTKYELAPIAFNSMDTTKLRDPKYKGADLAFFADKCHRLFLARLKVIMARLKDPHHQLAVARFFCFKQPVIPKDEYGQLTKTIKPVYKRRQSSATPAAAEQGHTLEEATNNATNTAQPTPTLPELTRYQPPWSNK